MRLLAFLITCWLALPAFAQTLPDYTAWESVASRAEEAVANARASDPVFERLREEIESFREAFSAAQNLNAARLETLNDQIAALGAAPQEGAVEAPDVAARRAELTDQASELAAPGLRAGEAFRRADGIIREIDAILRDRRAAALLSRAPSPLSPAIWADAFQDIERSVSLLREGVARALANGSAEASIRSSFPLILTLLVVALIFVLRARRWLELFGNRLEGEASGAGLRVSGFIFSLGQVIVPMIGLVALSRALILTGLFSFHGETLISLIPAFGLAFFVARWLAGRLFPSAEGALSPLNFPVSGRLGARFLLMCLGLALVAYGVLRAIASIDGYPLATRAALEFPFLVVLGYLLYRVGLLLATHEESVGAEGEPQPSVLDRLVGLCSRLAKAVGLLGPIAALIGYTNLSEALIVPSVHTLALFAVLALLVDFSRDCYTLLGRQKGPDESLVAVLIAIALFLAAVPLLAIIWGATLTDLSEIWVRVRGGITLGETTISPGSFLVLLLVFLAGYMVTRFVQSALRSSVLPKTRLDIGGQTAVVSGVGYFGIFIAVLIALGAAGINLTTLAFIAGTLGVGIGFGLQNIVSNFISGIILLVERPISEGDWIEVGGQMGYVRDISVRSTRIETFDRTDVIVPNADLISGTVTNYTRGNSVGRVIVSVGVAYGTDTRKIEAILREIAEAHPMVTLNPPPNILFIGFGADSLDFQIRAILRDVNWVMNVKSDLNHAIAERFTKEGIEIPFAQRDVWLRNPESLKATDEEA